MYIILKETSYILLTKNIKSILGPWKVNFDMAI